MPKVRRCRQYGCHAMVELPNHYCTEHFEYEAEYLESRQRWARSHNSEYSHKYNTVTRNRNDDKREQYNFYRTKQWVHLRTRCLERDHYLCRYCLIQDVMTTAKTADHIIPIEANQSLRASIDNIADICSKCHRLKTDWEHSYYGTGQGNQLKDVEQISDLMVIVYLMNSEKGGN